MIRGNALVGDGSALAASRAWRPSSSRPGNALSFRAGSRRACRRWRPSSRSRRIGRCRSTVGLLAVSKAARSASPLIKGAYFSRNRARPMRILRQRVADHGADHIALFQRIQRFEVAPAIAVIQFDLLRRLAPPPRRPVDVGAQPDRLAACDIRDDVEREVMAADVALRARLQQQPLLAQFARQIGDARGAKRGDGAVRLAAGQVDHRQPRRHLGARRALEPAIDLVLQAVRWPDRADRRQPADRRDGGSFRRLAARSASTREIHKTARARRPAEGLSPFAPRKICANSADAASCPCRAISELGSSLVAVLFAASASP